MKLKLFMYLLFLIVRQGNSENTYFKKKKQLQQVMPFWRIYTACYLL